MLNSASSAFHNPVNKFVAKRAIAHSQALKVSFDFPGCRLSLNRGGGHIINITSSLVDNANSNVPSVLASLTKGGLQSATKSLAIEYAADGIRVNAVSPGIIKTPMHPKDNHEALGALLPVGRMGEQSDVVDAVMYLEDASFVTGEILHVDGGQSAGR